MSGVRIFVEPSGYRWGNIGDALMLEVALERLRSSWPDASITVHTLEPDSLLRLDPRAQPLEPWGARGWSADALALGRTPLTVLRRRFPRVMSFIARAALRAKRRDASLLRDYLDAVKRADLVLVAGAGSLNDSFQPNALAVLETLELAIEAGAITALAGQGLGPMTGSALLRRAKAVLPRVDFIALREGVAGPPLLAALGVPADRIVVTGDDAITRAYAARPDHLGSELGLNLRAASYSNVGDALVTRIGRVVRDLAPIVPIATSHNEGEDDLDTVRRATGNDLGGIELFDALHRCRVVVAGSYHAAVLALSMGISAVTIASSAYYVDKFRGLAAQFGDACRLVVVSGDFESRLRVAIDEAWRTAEEMREPLLEAAARQIALSLGAYRTITELVEARRIVRNRS